ncbi:MAG: hypothetical protein WC178_00815 [Candidatus Paceibacterota bacterium]
MQAQASQIEGSLTKRDEYLEKIKELLEVAKNAQEKKLIETFYRSLNFAIYYIGELNACNLFLQSSYKDFCNLRGEGGMKSVVFSEEAGQIRLSILEKENTKTI